MIRRSDKMSVAPPSLISFYFVFMLSTIMFFSSSSSSSFSILRSWYIKCVLRACTYFFLFFLLRFLLLLLLLLLYFSSSSSSSKPSYVNRLLCTKLTFVRFMYEFQMYRIYKNKSERNERYYQKKSLYYRIELPASHKWRKRSGGRLLEVCTAHIQWFFLSFFLLVFFLLLLLLHRAPQLLLYVYIRSYFIAFLSMD